MLIIPYKSADKHTGFGQVELSAYENFHKD